MPMREALSVTRILTADVEPFGVFNVEESVVDGDAFVAVGPRAWVATLGDDLLRRLRRFHPMLATDTRTLSAGVALRDFEGHVDVDGRALLRARLRARYDTHQDRGCIVLLWAITDPGDAPLVADFMESLEWASDVV